MSTPLYVRWLDITFSRMTGETDDESPPRGVLVQFLAARFFPPGTSRAAAVADLTTCG